MNSNVLSLVHTFDLVTESEVGVANITQLTVTSDGLTLYALTPSKVWGYTLVCVSRNVYVGFNFLTTIKS